MREKEAAKLSETRKKNSSPCEEHGTLKEMFETAISTLIFTVVMFAAWWFRG